MRQVGGFGTFPGVRFHQPDNLDPLGAAVSLAAGWDRVEPATDVAEQSHGRHQNRRLLSAMADSRPVLHPGWTRRGLTLALCLGQFGCGGGWRSEPMVPPGPPDPSRQVQLWIAGKRLVLHGVTVDQTEVTGIPFQRPLGCDSCRVSIPRAAVDSMRVSTPPAGFWKTLAITLGGGLAGVILVCGAATTCRLGD